MTREEWTRVKAVVSEALVCPPADRPAQLAAACGSDAVLRQEAESLLDAVVRASGLYEGDALHVTSGLAGPDGWPGLAAGVVRAAHLPAHDDGQGREFTGTERYGVRRRLGIGGMGVVYEVEDRARRQVVALKTLRRWHPAEIVRLKREFRSLADIAHPNLVPLYELEADDAHCFITMALVDGVSFVEYVRGGGGSDGVTERVRQCLPQLVAGVHELHRCGTLHGDIKPSNVLVTPDGRVSLLDFGLASAVGAHPDTDGAVFGTPAYLSPEQCAGATGGVAGDWYALGATLYHALTGATPFDGALIDIMRRKAAIDAPLPSSVVPAVPPDLDDIVAGLLRRDPERRWQAPQVLERLQGRPLTPRTSPSSPASGFVGREAYLEMLGSAWQRVRQGTHAAVYVHGPSGIGKSALLRRFLETAARERGVVVLDSRCHEHESLPYKGLDGIVDGLSRVLRAQPSADAARLAGGDAWALARLFPVMRDAGPLDHVAAEALSADPIALRRRAFEALRDTLDRLARDRPVIVAVDDFHWADAESAAVLESLFAAPAPPLLLLVSFRSEELETRPFLRRLVERLDPRTALVLPLAPLSEAEAVRLARDLLEGSPAAAAEREAIAREAGGHPLLLEELARGLDDGAGEWRGVSLDAMLTRRLGRLPPEARAFLEMVAVCGRPIAAARAYEACGLSGDERPLVARLRATHFLRGSRTPGHVEMYHDRLRETLAAAVAAEDARAIHHRLADLLLAHGDDDPEALFDHCRAAGRHEAAAAFAAAAARKAAGVLAFDRAAGFYRHALALQPQAGDAPEWTVGLASCLENAGRPAEAAETYLAATRHAHGADRIEWRRKAAELLLVGGRIDRGLAVSDEVLSAVGVRTPRGSLAALTSLALRRTHLRWRGLAVADRRAPAGRDRLDRLRMDACWSIAVGLAMVDPLRAAAVNVRQLGWALDAGDARRAARALALEAGFAVIVPAGAAWYRHDDPSLRALALAQDDDRHYVAALTAAWRGIAAFLSGRWTEATGHCDRAAALLREHCTGVMWESNLAHGFLLYSLVYRGELREAGARLPGLLAAAQERGNVYLALELSTRLSILSLAADRPVETEQRANDGIAQWAQHGFQRPHYHHLLTRIQVRLYRAEVREAWDLLDAHRGHLRQPLFRHVQHTRVELANVRARCALARAAVGDDARHMRGVAAREARAIARERMPWAAPFAALIRAALAFQAHDVATASHLLQAAMDGFAAADMALYAAATRWRLAAVLGGEPGRTLRAEAERWFGGQDVRNPDALVRVLAPGFPDRTP